LPGTANNKTGSAARTNGALATPTKIFFRLWWSLPTSVCVFALLMQNQQKSRWHVPHTMCGHPPFFSIGTLQWGHGLVFHAFHKRFSALLATFSPCTRRNSRHGTPGWALAWS
jgi:hypothetical protein